MVGGSLLGTVAGYAAQALAVPGGAATPERDCARAVYLLSRADILSGITAGQAADDRVEMRELAGRLLARRGNRRRSLLPRHAPGREPSVLPYVPGGHRLRSPFVAHRAGAIHEHVIHVLDVRVDLPRNREIERIGLGLDRLPRLVFAVT